MQLYHAPLEGIGSHIYRRAQSECFPKADKYFTAFVVANQTHSFKTKEKEDMKPENNPGIYLVPQIMTNDSGHCAWAIEEIASCGYQEINLNLGCPSRTVVTKGRGAGLIKDTDRLHRFLEYVYGHADPALQISVKTRIGIAGEDEFPELLAIFNEYPISELILHPRLQSDYYKNHPHMEMYEYARQHARMPLVYNGDLFTAEDYQMFAERYPDAPAAMMGRGVMTNPCLFGEIRREEELTPDSLKHYLEVQTKGYKDWLHDDTTVLYKLKEHWFYLMDLFEHAEKYAKQIQKARRLSEYETIVHELFSGNCWKRK